MEVLKSAFGLKKNILILGITKITTIAVSFFLYPISLQILTNEEYGVWITINSIVSWFVFFDFGIGNTFKTLLTGAIENKNFLYARKILMSLYTFFLYLFLPLSILLILLSLNVNWQFFFKVSSLSNSIIRDSIIFTISTLVLKLILDNIFILLAATHKAYAQGLFLASSSLIVLCLLHLSITFGFKVSFFNFILLNTLIPLVLLIIINLVVFKKLFQQLQLRFRDYSFDLIKKSSKTSIYFFIIQIMYLVIFSTDNFIITKIFGAGEATTYNVSFKYFSVVTIIFTTIMAPIWPTLTVFNERKDINSIKNLFHKTLYAWISLSVVTCLMILVAPFFINLWLKGKVKVPFILNIGMALFVILSTWCMIFATYLNSINKIKLQAISSLLTGAINIPLAIYLGSYTNLGSAGVIFATCISLMFTSVILPFECKKHFSLILKS